MKQKLMEQKAYIKLSNIEFMQYIFIVGFFIFGILTILV